MSLTPNQGRDLKVSVENTVMRYGPDLLNARQAVTAQILVEGQPTQAPLNERVSHFLGNTSIEYRQAPPQYSPQKSRIPAFLAIAGIVLGLVSGGAILLTKLAGPIVNLSPDSGPAGTLVELKGINFGKFSVIEVRTPLCMPATVIQSPSPQGSGATLPSGVSESSRPVAPSDRNVIGTTQANSSGRFEVKISIPQGCGKGPLSLGITANGIIVEYASVTFYVT